MQKVFNLTNKYIVLTTPLILYSLITNVYLGITASGGKVINLLFAIFLFTLMTGAFIAGWFNMIKLAITGPEREEPNTLIKEFTSGVGEFFLPSIGAIFVMFLISILALVSSYHIGMLTIGDIGISVEAFSNAIKSSAELKAFISGLSTEQLMKINLWNLLILISITITYLLCFLYLPTLFFKNKNPFIAFCLSLKDLFSKKFFYTIGVFILIFVLNSFISLFSAIFSGNVIMHFILTVLNFYFITAVGIGLFYYYYHNFIEPLVGQNVDIKI